MRKICVAILAFILVISMVSCDRRESPSPMLPDKDNSSVENREEPSGEEVLSNEPAYFETEVCASEYSHFCISRNYYSADGRILSTQSGYDTNNFYVCEKTEYEYDENGRLERVNFYSNKNESGLLEMYSYPLKLSCYYEFAYGENDLPIIGYKYTAEGKETDNIVVIEYHDNGAPKKWNTYDDGLSLSFAEYDELGRKVRQENIANSSGAKESKAIFEYEGDSKSVSRADVLANGYYYYRLELEYDGDGMVSEITRIDKHETKSTTLEYYDDSGLLKSCNGYIYYVNDKGGDYSRSEVSYKYSPEGFLEEYLIKGDETLCGKGAGSGDLRFTFRYENDRLVFAEQLDETVHIAHTRTVSYDYDERGNKISRSDIIKYGEEYFYNVCTEWEYDTDNKLICESMYEEAEENRVLFSLTSYEYNQEGTLIKCYHGDPVYCVEDYDERGNRIKSIYYSEDKLYMTIEDEYDDKNNKTHSVTTEYFSIDNEDSVVTRVYEYYYNPWGYCTLYRYTESFDDGRKIVRERKYNNFGREMDNVYIEYDAEGNIVSQEEGAK